MSNSRIFRLNSRSTKNDGYRYDAKEKGNNEYEGESGRHKKRREEEPENEGKVILKGQGSHFDIKI